MERPRGVNLIYSGGGDPLCTLHRAEGLYHHSPLSTLEWPLAVHSRLCGWSYLIKFLIRNLSYSLCSQPNRTVLFPDVMFTMYARNPHSGTKPALGHGGRGGVLQNIAVLSF